MIQEILTYAVVLYAIIYSVYHIFRMFSSNKKATGCSGACVKCKLKHQHKFSKNPSAF